VRDFGDRQSTADRALALRGWLGFHSVNGITNEHRAAAQRSGLELGNNRLSFKLNSKNYFTVVLFFPFVGNKPSVMQEFFFSFPFSFYEYQNKACFYTL
jgi:hypothetical protein